MPESTDYAGTYIRRSGEPAFPCWYVVRKAPARNRARFWTVAHIPVENGAACTEVDIPQTLVTKAITGKAGLPPCVDCTPAEQLPSVSHGMHMACRSPHLIGSPCPASDACTITPEGKHVMSEGDTAPDVPELADGALMPDQDGPASIMLGASGRCSMGEHHNCAHALGGPQQDGVLADGVMWRCSCPCHAADSPTVYAPTDKWLKGAHEAAQAAAGADVFVLGQERRAIEDVHLPEPIESAPVLVRRFDGTTWATTVVDLGALDDGEDIAPPVPVLPEPLESSVPVRVIVEPQGNLHDADAGTLVVHGRVDALEEPQDILDVIREAMHGRARNHQRRPGPSQIGGCERRLGYHLAFGEGNANNRGDESWRPEVGTATHAWLGRMFEGREDFLTDVEVTAPIPGILDLFWIPPRVVVDFKLSGKTTRDKAARGEVSEKYQTQLDLYGLGMVNLGYEVRSVALLFLPPAGSLSESVWYSRPFDPDRARAGAARLDRIEAMLSVAEPARVLAALSTTEDFCSSCPALGTHCPGAERPRRTPDLTLVGAS